MRQVSAHETLRRLFDAILTEAEQNPRLAAQLAAAVGQTTGTAPQPPGHPARKAFDAAQLHAVNILRAHGEAALRGKLEQVRTVDDLKSVARASGLVLAGEAGKVKAGRAQLITGIIEAAKHYEAQRGAATA